MTERSRASGMAGLCSVISLGVVLVLASSTPRALAGTFPGSNGLLVFDAGCAPPCEGGITTISPDGSNRTVIVSPLDLNGRVPVIPDWNADGTRVAFMAGDGSTNSSELYVADGDGSNVQRLIYGSHDRSVAIVDAGRTVFGLPAQPADLEDRQ